MCIRDRNLEWTITQFAERGRGHITFPTKFHMVDPLLNLDHRGKAIFRMSVNPQPIIKMCIRDRVWRFGKERKNDFFSSYISNVEYYRDGYYLVHSGGMRCV